MRINLAGSRRVGGRAVIASLLAAALCAVPLKAGAEGPVNEAVAYSDTIRSKAWNGKFLYGAYSTLIATHLMWREFRWLAHALNDPNSEVPRLRAEMQRYQKRYNTLRDYEVRQILAFADAHRSLTVFDERQSVIRTEAQNALFLTGMFLHPELAPVDLMIRDGKFRSSNFQVNAHRGLHSNADLIPPNSMAALVTAYVAGIRSAEMDVLETCEANYDGPCERIPVVIHDLSINRLIGDYAWGSLYVNRHDLAFFQDRFGIGVLNPLAEKPSLQSTGIRGLMTAERMLRLAAELAPEMTLYLDARNKSPTSLLRMMHNNREERLGANAVIKVYPFVYNAGASALVEDYAKNARIPTDQARKEIAELTPNLLLALGNVGREANEAAAGASEIINSEDFARIYYSGLPYNSAAAKSPLNLNPYVSKPEQILDDIALQNVEAMTWRGFMWAASFTAIGNVMILQMNVTPSLGAIATAPHIFDRERLFSMMTPDDKMDAAVAYNLQTLFSLVRKGQAPFFVNVVHGDDRLSALLANARFGSADRYPDYSMGDPAAELRHFYYSMDGLAQSKKGVSVEAMRSSTALLGKISELAELGLDLNYYTTDLPTDVRAALMNLLGKYGLPDDVTYRQNALVKPRFTPADVKQYEIPVWVTQLYNAPTAKDPEVQKYYSEIGGYTKAFLNWSRAYDSITYVAAHPAIPLMNETALWMCLHSKTPVYRAKVSDEGWKNLQLCVTGTEGAMSYMITRLNREMKEKFNFTIYEEVLPPGF